jgi:hypothetical protein
MENRNELLDLVIRAHGGLEKWNQLKQMKLHLSTDGYIWTVKGHEGALRNINMIVNLHEQGSVQEKVFSEGLRAIFEPKRVRLTTQEDKLVEQLLNPRDTFKGLAWEDHWSRLQFIYFSLYATYTYFTTPFNLTLPGVVTNEIEPWAEAGEMWRRLEVSFPDNFVTHSKRQVFYFDENGLLKRHDYWAETLGGAGAAHYVFDYKEFNGIKMPTRRNIYQLQDNNNYVPEPVLVTMKVLSVKFESRKVDQVIL